MPMITARLLGVMSLAWTAVAYAQPTPRAPAAPASAASAPTATQLDQVRITGSRPSDLEERRQSTAAKIVIGRDEIERFGDSSVGDLLKRLPGVTIQGRPGRGGNIRMRGLGSGYTQILLDGQRVPPGFSLDSLTPEQIERIEILRAPTAETGARAIAGTINIITREGFSKRINDLRLVAAIENDRLQPSVSWTRNDTIGPFTYNYSLTAFSQDRETGATTTTVDRNRETGEVTLDQRDVAQAREKRHGVHASGRLQWRSEGAADVLTLLPIAIYSAGSTERRGTLTQTVGSDPAPYEQSQTSSEGDFSLLRLNGQWNHRFDDGGRVETKFGLGQAHSKGTSLRNEFIGGANSRTLDDRNDTIDRNALASTKYLRVLDGDHSLVAGAEAEVNRRTEQRTTLQDGAPLLVDFGDNVGASATRVALYAQDEWNLTPQWAAHAGLRWEGIRTRGSGGGSGGDADTIDDANGTRNTSSVWTPLLHAVWKPEASSRDQVRFSLTRSYRSPSLQSLIARPSLNTRYPAPGANTPTQPDRAGNPNLRPELATGIDVAIERYLPGSGLLSANVFRRNIRDYMRSQTTLETVPWATEQRWVSRPQNIGSAVTQGIELEAKLRLSDLMADAPRVDVRANASVFRSRVKSVPGPDNRLDQQPDGTANLGADYKFAALPLTIGGNLNWTPAYDTRVSEDQTAYQGRKLIVDAYALWAFSPTVQLRVTASNLAARDYLTGGALDFDNLSNVPVRETSTTTAPTYLNLQFKLEIKL
jgi:outer membrane receptor for ferrienterochelin and colicins